MFYKILITGSTGFVGRHLVPKILNCNHQVLEITRSISKSSKLFGDKTIKIEIDDPLLKEKVLEFDPNIVIHLASYLTSSDHWDDIQKLIETNLLFLSRILNVVSNTNLSLFINTGTFAEYRDGNNELQPAYFYAATKTASRAILDYYSNTYNFKQVTIIPYTIYGGIDSQKKIIDLIFDSLNSDIPLNLTQGDQILDFIHIHDVTDFYCLLIKNISKIKNKAVYKLGTGHGNSLRQLSKLIEEITQKKANICWGGKPYRTSDVMYAVATNNYKLLDWEPKISLKEGIENLIK